MLIEINWSNGDYSVMDFISSMLESEKLLVFQQIVGSRMQTKKIEWDKIDSYKLQSMDFDTNDRKRK